MTETDLAPVTGDQAEAHCKKAIVQDFRHQPHLNDSHVPGNTENEGDYDQKKSYP